MIFMYLDPSATTAIIASIAAVAAAIGSVFIIWWRKAKKKTKEILHIDENANKEVEDELVINDEEDKPVVMETKAEEASTSDETKNVNEETTQAEENKEEKAE